MNEKKLKLQPFVPLPEKMYEQLRKRASSMDVDIGEYIRWLIVMDIEEHCRHYCKDCRYSNTYHVNDNDFTVCTQESVWNTKGDMITFGYKKINDEDVACEKFEEGFR